MSVYKVSVVNYLNSKPFIYGLKNFLQIQDKIQLVEEYPAQCAESLATGEIDLALMPVAKILQLKDPHIVSSYCIGSETKVKSVGLFSDVPIEEVKNVILDYQSRTSVRLFQILAEEYWKIHPRYLNSEPGFIDNIQGDTAGIVIGDRTIPLFEKYKYVYDLGETWKSYTGLPFVYAAWVSTKALDSDFIELFHEANTSGMLMIDQIVKDYASYNHSSFSIEEYFKKNISYDLSDNKRKALLLFLKKLSQLENKELPVIQFQLPSLNLIH